MQAFEDVSSDEHGDMTVVRKAAPNASSPDTTKPPALALTGACLV